MFDVGGQQDSSDVLIVCFEVSDGHELGFFAVLEEMPDVDAALNTIHISITFSIPHLLEDSDIPNLCQHKV